MLRSEGELRVRRFVLDVGEVAYSDTEVTDALKSAQREIWQLAAATTPAAFCVAVTKTGSIAGVVDLTAEDPLRVVNVAELSGEVRYPIAGGTLLDVRTHLTSALRVEVIYVPRCAYPANANDPFVWGTSEETEIYDELMVLTAVAALLVKEDTINKALEQRAAALRLSLEKKQTTTTFRAFSTRPQPRSSYRWHKLSGDTFQLFCV